SYSANDLTWASRANASGGANLRRSWSTDSMIAVGSLMDLIPSWLRRARSRASRVGRSVHLAAQLIQRTLERSRVALLRPPVPGAHLEPAQLDGVGLVAHLAARDLDRRALLGVEQRDHVGLEAGEDLPAKVRRLENRHGVTTREIEIDGTVWACSA